MLVSVSMSHDRTSERHSRRDYTPMNVEPKLSERNVRVIDSPSFQDAFNDIFADAIDEYNAKQKRADRKKSHDYWSEITAARHDAEGDNVAQTTYTYVLQLGDRDTLGVTDDSFDSDHWMALKSEDPDAAAAYVAEHLNDSEERARAKECLTAFVKTLPSRYPQLRFIEIIGHDDEPNGTFHFDLTFVPVGEGYKTGLSKRDSLTRALNMMGFKSSKGEGLAITQWQDDVKARLEEFMGAREYGFERDFKDNHEKHRSLGTFQMEQRLDQLSQDIETSELAVADAERHMLDTMDREADIINEASEAAAELEVARHAKRDAEEDARKAREKADDAERRAVAAKQQESKSIEIANEHARRINEAANKEAERIRQKAKNDADAAAESRRMTKTALDDAKTLLADAKTISEDEAKLRESVKVAARPQARETMLQMVLRKAGHVISDFMDRRGYEGDAQTFGLLWEKHVVRNVRTIAKGIAAAVWPTEAQRKVVEEMQRQSDAQREMSNRLAALRQQVTASDERTAISEDGYDWHDEDEGPQMGE